MALALVVDASSAAGTVAVLRDGIVVAEGEAVMRSGDREFLLPAVQGALMKAGVSVRDLDQVICGGGPGSFTSLRIAGSIAKGLAHARRIPLFVISSLDLLIGERERQPGLYVAAIDALRGEHYVKAVRVDTNGRVEIMAHSFDLVASDQLEAYARVQGATLVGAPPGEEGRPHARGAARSGAVAVDLETWEPDYGRLAEAQVKWEAAHGRPLQAE
jgi:tRNA threonylcarbamoyl adenosine modification protein YeaZ